MIDFDSLVNGSIAGVFGESIQYTSTASGTTTTLSAPFQEPYKHQTLSEDGSAVWTQVSPSFGCRLSSLPDSPARGDTVTRASNGASYLVYDSIPDGVGWTRILLKILK